MAGNHGKFIDRSPNIRPAGVISNNFEASVENTLREYHMSELAVPAPGGVQYKLPPLKNNRHQGIFTLIRPILRPPTETNYQTVINELKETTYSSSWNKVLGKSRDPVPNLPPGFDRMNVTFGQKSEPSDISDLINPAKTDNEVSEESEKGHELYKKSHNDYFVGEKIDRNYLSPPYNADKRFGEYTYYNPNGIWVRCCCRWHNNEPVTIANRVQADYFERCRPKLGTSLTPNNNINSVPEGHTFGHPPDKDHCELAELIRDNDLPACAFKRDFESWIQSFNILKKVLHRKPNFCFEDFSARLEFYDDQQDGTISLEKFHQVCGEFRIRQEWPNIEKVLTAIGIIGNGRILYRVLVDWLDFRKPYNMVLNKLVDVPKQHQYYTTTSQAAGCDYLIIDNSKSPPAGVPAVRFDLAKPIVYPGQCKSHLENFGDETSTHALISPSIYLNYGLNFRDFFIPRPAQVIRDLFRNSGYELDDETFDKLWKMGLEFDNTGAVCVDTFKKLVQIHVKPPE